MVPKLLSNATLEDVLSVLSDLSVGRFQQKLGTTDDSILKAIIEKLNETSQALEVQARRNEAGLPSLTSGIKIDTAEREQLEAVLNYRKLRLSEIEENSQSGSWSAVLPSYKVTWSDQNYRLYGLSPDTFTPTFQSFVNLFHPDDRRAIEEWSRALLEGENPSRIQARVIWPDGSVRIIEGGGKLICDAENRPVRMFGTNRDVTERHRHEELLRESEERLKLALEGVGDGVWDGDVEKGRVKFSKQLEEMLGYSEGELPTETDKYASFIHPDDLPLAMVDFQSCLEGKTVIYKNEHRVRCKDGSWKWILDRGMVVSRDLSGKPVRIIGTHVDLTDRKETEKELALLLIREQKAREEAERANRTKDEFLATLSHELRTPLTTILAWSQMLRMGRLDPEKSKRGIEILEQSAKAQGQLIDDLLDISCIQAGKLKLVFESIDPLKVVSASIDSVRILALNKSVQIETETDSSIASIIADPHRLQQILWNLITNAIKFSPQGGKITIKLSRRTNSSEDQLRIQVSDEGKGINPEFLPIIFDRFSQADSSMTRAYGGLGLGLSIVQKLVGMHGGTVEVASKGEGKGATFTVFLPMTGH